MISVEEATVRLLSLVGARAGDGPAAPRHGPRAGAKPSRRGTRSRPSPPPRWTATRCADGPARGGTTYRLVGTAAAGRLGARGIGPGEAVRIFTGATLPEGARRVVIQEDVRSRDGIRISGPPEAGAYVRPAGGDFDVGRVRLRRDRLGSRTVALLAAMGVAEVPVVRRPEVAILMTGDELRAPGEALGPGQIVGSNGYGLAAMVEAAGAAPRLLPIARDDASSLRLAFDLARGADLIVTIGGASVGDHDLVAGAAGAPGSTSRSTRSRCGPANRCWRGAWDRPR